MFCKYDRTWYYLCVIYPIVLIGGQPKLILNTTKCCYVSMNRNTAVQILHTNAHIHQCLRDCIEYFA